MEQRRRLNSRTVHSPSFPLNLFCKSIFIVFAFFCFLFWLLFIFNLPPPSQSPKRLNRHFFKADNRSAAKDRQSWGFFGEMMVGMLPTDLPFTVFVPSEQHFRRILGPNNFTAVNSTSDNTVAIVSRILGFSAVPLHLVSRTVPLNGEVVVDSLSGFRVQVGRSSNGSLFVNNMTCEVTDMKRGQIIVHVVQGVIMDAEFEQSVRPEDDDDE